MNLSQSIDYILWCTLWMSWNVSLALIPVVLAYLLDKMKNILLEIPTLFVWFIFLPNTLYMVTDGMYVFSEDFRNMHVVGMAIGIILYATIVALAPFTYYWALSPVIQKYKKFILQLQFTLRFILTLSFSLLVALGISMGRFARTNSWP